MERRERDRPWIFRTYAGYASPGATNARFKANLAKGQTGLSVAFDLPTQTGYDSGHPMARGEVGKVGVPISHLGDMKTVFEGIPVAEMNTSMTINATAVWLLALYVATADDQGASRSELAGTTQNDILKEYLSRGTHIFPPEPSIRLTTDLVTWTFHEVPKWNPINVCSYHLQEAGADPVLEVSFALANAITVLDAVKATGAVPESDFGRLVGRISFFCNAGIRFVEETCKMRAFGRMWRRIATERYGVDDDRYRRFRYGVQVNSLGLTAAQPENNVYRILLEMLAVTQSKDARARAVQLPAWNEALGLPRAWDQQWSLRAQQILALETDLLEHDDVFEGSHVIESLTSEIEEEAQEELTRVLEAGGSVEALGYMKERLVAAHSERRRAIESGEQTVVGVNAYAEAEPSPLVEGLDVMAFEKIDPAAEAAQIERLEDWRKGRDSGGVAAALDVLKRAAESGDNLLPPSIEAAHAGVTTGEWADALRDVFGEYRAPTGVGGQTTGGSTGIERAQSAVRDAAARAGVAKLRMLVAKPGLDGHSNAAEQVAVRARDAGFEVVYQGIRLSPEQIARAAADEDVHVVAISILSGAHGLLIPDVIDRLKAEGIDPQAVPVIVGGVIPDDDAAKLEELGVARVYTPRDYDMTGMIAEIASLIPGASLTNVRDDPRLTILLLDPEDLGPNRLHAALGAAATIGGAGSLDQALRSLDSSDYDVVVVNLATADPEGPDLVSAVVGAAPSIPVVVITGPGSDDTGLRAIRAGAQDHFVEGERDAASLLRALRYAIERKRREQGLVRHARYDPLTDLPNRTLFRETLDRALARADRTKQVVAVLWLDLDGFRTATRGWPRERSDELLRQVGVRLHRSVRQVDTVAHPAGDEFTILLEGLSGPRDAEIVARKIGAALTEPLLPDEPVRLSASIGISWYPGGSSGRDDLLDHASAGLTAAKEAGPGGFSFHPGHS